MYINDSHRRAVARAAERPDSPVSTPPSWVLDRVADRKLDGGFTKRHIKRHGVCTTCFQVRSVTNACGC